MLQTFWSEIARTYPAAEMDDEFARSQNTPEHFLFSCQNLSWPWVGDVQCRDQALKRMSSFSKVNTCKEGLDKAPKNIRHMKNARG